MACAPTDTHQDIDAGLVGNLIPTQPSHHDVGITLAEPIITKRSDSPGIDVFSH
jgi:hypothetical protein